MDTKKKVIVSVSAFVVVLVATVVAVVSVLAASKVSFSSSINVTYVVGDVVADVAVSTAKVKTNATSITWGTPKTKNFGIDHSGTAETIALDNYTNIGKDECVVIKFVFNNNSAKGFTAKLPTPPTGTNMNVFYSTSESGLAALTSGDYNTSGVTVQGGADKSATYYAVIKIATPTSNATFNSSFAWTLE